MGKKTQEKAEEGKKTPVSAMTPEERAAAEVFTVAFVISHSSISCLQSYRGAVQEEQKTPLRQKGKGARKNTF